MYAYTLEQLLSLDVHQSAIQILDLLHQIRDLSLITALNITRRSNRQIQRQLNTSQLLPSQPPTLSRAMTRRKANLVISTVRRRECELSGADAARRNDAVVVIKHLVDGDEDVEVWVWEVGVTVQRELFGGVLANDEGVFWEALEETFWSCAVNVEVEGLDWDHEGRGRGGEGGEAHLGCGCVRTPGYVVEWEMWW